LYNYISCIKVHVLLSFTYTDITWHRDGAGWYLGVKSIPSLKASESRRRGEREM